MQMTTVIMSRVGSELSPGGTPPAAATIVGAALASILTTVPTTAKADTAVMPASMPVRERVGRSTGGVPTDDELPKDDHGIEFAITSVTPVT